MAFQRLFVYSCTSGMRYAATAEARVWLWCGCHVHCKALWHLPSLPIVFDEVPHEATSGYGLIYCCPRLPIRHCPHCCHQPRIRHCHLRRNLPLHDSPCGSRVDCCAFRTQGWAAAYCCFCAIFVSWTTVLILEIKLYTVANTLAQWYFSASAPGGLREAARQLLGGMHRYSQGRQVLTALKSLLSSRHP